MARRFLYSIVFVLVLVIAAMFALRLWPGELARLALIPTSAFEAQAPLAANAYDDRAMWFARPGIANDPARWRPPGTPAPEYEGPAFAVFFVHPTSYYERSHWNGPLGDEQSNRRARLFLRGMASPFAAASEIWAPRYRQATFGAFLTDKTEAQQAIDAAYRDVAQAFDHFLAQVGAERPIVLVGHSQGTHHLLRLLRERVAGRPLQARIAMVYAIGWPISIEHDLPALGLDACAGAAQTGCIVSWSSFAEPAEPEGWLELYRGSTGFDGKRRGASRALCVNPLNGLLQGSAPASANLGTLVPNEDLTGGELVAGSVPARCDERGLLLIGDPPQLGEYVLPGNNYHVSDIPLFWRNLERDVARRMGAWATAG